LRTIFQVILAFVFPPLAVLERGCGTVLLVSVLTLLGWLPGVILALFMTLTDRPGRNPAKRKKFIQIPVHADAIEDADEPKYKGAYIRLADGEVAEVVEDDHEGGEKRKRG
jgi:uncharacterized membrane protein YqaE (UPF0057 family)